LIALARYIRRTGDLHVNDLFNQSLTAFSGKIVNNPLSHTSMLRAKLIYNKGENSSIVYAANGKIKIESKHLASEVSLNFTIKKGWHINSNKVTIESLIPLSIKSDVPLVFNFPKAKQTRLAFNDSELSTFEGKISVNAHAPKDNKKPYQITLKLQACSDKICLAPSEVSIKVYQKDL
jgi:hypothetical protein